MSDSSIPSDDEISSFLGDLSIPAGDADEMTFIPPGEDFVAPTDDGDIASGFEESTVQIGDGTCRVCGSPTFRPPGLTKTGRKKRAPGYCDLHDPKRKVSNERPFSRGVESQLQRVQDELADDLRLLGAMAGPLLPVTGYYVFEHADAFTIALLKLAKNNQNMLRVLHRVAQVAPIYTVAEVVAGTAYSVQVDLQKADPHNTISQRLGVEKAYNALYPEDQTNVSNNGFQGPPKYATVQ
jgi:hypothetical protein